MSHASEVDPDGQVVALFTAFGTIITVPVSSCTHAAIAFPAADVPIHFAIDDMQIAEDTQTIIGHMIVQWLYAQRAQFAER